MILQGSLRIEYNNHTYGLMVKTFLKNNVYYFFVTDKGKEKTLLDGQTLELTYSDSFCTSPTREVDVSSTISPEVISAVQNMLMENKELWFY